jgi:DNA-directed RNA polymerase I subunit RPA12
MVRAYKAEKEDTDEEESHGATVSDHSFLVALTLSRTLLPSSSFFIPILFPFQINEECPQCGHNEMYFTTAQLRSADEGQTVFYECISCGHKFSVNT